MAMIVTTMFLLFYEAEAEPSPRCHPLPSHPFLSPLLVATNWHTSTCPNIMLRTVHNVLRPAAAAAAAYGRNILYIV